MISNQQSLNLSPYMGIYDIVVPKDNMLRQINDPVDFSFVYEEIQNKYSLDTAPEDGVINSSSLTKFRKLRLKDVNLLDMLIQNTEEIALEKEIIKSSAIIVDATHTKARFNQKSPKEILMEKSKLLRKAVYQIDEKMKDKIPSKTKELSADSDVGICVLR